MYSYGFDLQRLKSSCDTTCALPQLEIAPFNSGGVWSLLGFFKLVIRPKWWHLVIAISFMCTTYSVLSGNLMNHAERRNISKELVTLAPKVNCKAFLVFLLKHLSKFVLYLCWKSSCYDKKKLMYKLGKLIRVSHVHRFRERCNQYKRYRARSLYWRSLSPLMLCCLFTADWKTPLHSNRQPTHWSSHVKVRCHLPENFRGLHHPSPPFAGNSFNTLPTERKLLVIPTSWSQNTWI